MGDRVTVTGAEDAPWFPNMAEVMDRDPALLDDIATEWAVGRGELELEHLLSTHLPDEVVGRELSPDRAAIPIRTACWLMFLHGYWGGVKLGRRFRRVGAARGVQESGLVAEGRRPTEESLTDLCAGLVAVHAALAGSDGDRLAQLETSVRVPTVTGTIDGTAYNTGFFEPLLSPPPKGALPEHLVGDPTIVVASADRFLDVEYGPPVPRWLTHHKERHAATRAAHPDRWQAVVDGRPGETSLTQIWTDAYTRGVYNWGGDTVAHWKQRTLDAFLAASVRFNIQVEVISHAVMTAIVDPDGADLAQATRASALFVPSWLGTGIGIADERGARPTLVAD